MYEELVKSLRQCAEASCAGCKNDLVEIGCRGKLQIEAADAIEGLSSLVDHYGGETGIKNLEEYAKKYWDTLTKIPRWTPVTETLPKEENRTYWICTDTGYQCECRWTNNRFGIGESDEWGWSIADVPQYHEVVAWMFLPEPYEPPKEET